MSNVRTKLRKGEAGNETVLNDLLLAMYLRLEALEGLRVDNAGQTAGLSLRNGVLSLAPTPGVALAAVGSSPNANAATLTVNVLNLEPASATQPGVVTAAAQTIGGAKTFASMPQLSAGANLNHATTAPLQLNGSAGASGQLLVSAGAGATPAWQTPGAMTPPLDAYWDSIAEYTGTTTDATTYVTLATLSIAANAMRLIDVISMGIGSGTDDRFVQRGRRVYTRVGSAAPTSMGSASDPYGIHGYSDVAASGNDLIVRVQGSGSSSNMSWRAIVRTLSKAL